MANESFDALVINVDLSQVDDLFSAKIPIILLSSNKDDAVEIEALNAVNLKKELKKLTPIKSKNNEGKIELAKEKLKAVFDASRDAIVFTDLNGVIVDCNEAAVLSLSSPGEGMINRTAASFWKEEERSKIENDIMALLKKGEVTRGEYSYLKKNGEKTILDASLNLVKDENGHPLNIVVITRDITKRKKDGEYIHLLTSVVEQAPEGIVVFDSREGRVVFANSAWCEMRGIRDKSKLNEERLENIYETKQVQGSFGTDQVFRSRLTMLRKDQSKFQVQASIKLLEREDGQQVALHLVKKFSEIAREIRDIGSTSPIDASTRSLNKN